MAKLAPIARPGVVAKLGRDTAAGRYLRKVRAELTAHVGSRPTATQKALIERASWLSVHVTQLDARAAKRGGMTLHDSRTYLAFSNSLSRVLLQLGLQGAAAAPKSLAEHLASRSEAA